MATPPSPDVRDYHPLARLRRIIRTYVTLEGILFSLVFVVLWFWVTLALDFGIHYFFHIDLLDKTPWLRYVLISLFAALVAGVLAFLVFRRLFREFSDASLALVLEKRFPDLLGGRLITAVELADLEKAKQQGYSTDMILKTMKEARERVERVEVRRVFNWRRLALIGWSLFGIGAFVLLAIYPLSILLSLIGTPRPHQLTRTIAFNGVILLGCLLSFLLPIAFIGLWHRRQTAAYVVLGCAALCLSTTAVAYDRAFKIDNAMKLNDFTWRFYNAADLILDRNLAFNDTRWPADDYHIELLDFPVAEKRVEKGKYVTVRAYFCRFIVADNSSPSRWRPVLWKDLATVLPDERGALPELPLDKIHEYLVRLANGLENSPVGYDKTKLQLPDVNDIQVDLVLAALTDKTLEQPIFTPEEQAPFEALAAKLVARAADQKLGGRVLRNVEPPDELNFVSTRIESKRRQLGTLKNIDERRFVYQLNKPIQLEESIVFHVEAQVGDKKARTIERTVTQVEPPKMLVMDLQEFRPAYFYYLPPTGPRLDSLADRRKLLGQFRQPLRPIRTDSPPEMKEIAISNGSEASIYCTTDKPLQEVMLIPKNADFPGITSKDDLNPIRLKVNPDGKSFDVKFAATGKPIREWLVHEWLGNLPAALRPPSWQRAGSGSSQADDPVFPLIARTSDFEVVFKDTDNMTSSRSFKIKPIDDKPPEVNLYVDVIRRVQNRYMCTAKANIPFARESYATDDNGLHKLELTYEYISLANATVVTQKAEMAAWLWASSPLAPSIGDYLFRREILLRTVSSQKGPAPIKGAVPLASFDLEMLKHAADVLDLEMKKFVGNVPPTLEDLRRTTATTLPDSFDNLKNNKVSALMNRFEFKSADRPESFDIQILLPRLVDTDPATGVQPSYELTLNVRATDSNVLADSDRTAENKEAPLVFKVVPEAELLAIITREEGELALKLDDVIKRLETAQKNLQGSASRTPLLSPESSTSEQTRLEGILEVVGKARELTGEIETNYNRILEEYRANRFPDKLSSGISVKIVTPLREVQGKEFPTAEESLIKFHAALKTGNSGIAVPLAGPTVESVAQLLKRLIDIRREMGESLDLKKAAEKLLELINKENVAYSQILRLNTLLIDKLLSIMIKLPASATVNVAPGKTVKVPLGIEMPLTITTDPYLKFEIPTNSGLKIAPNVVNLQENARESAFEITAGTQTGTFSLRIIPSQGKPVDLKVVVK